MKEIRILLSQEDFRILVIGGIVTRDGVAIALQDIGYPRMHKIVMDAAVDQSKPFDQ